MFETLEDKLEKSKQPPSPGYPILIYGFHAVISSIALHRGVPGHGFSRLFSLVDWAVLFLLSVTWLVRSLRSPASMSRHDYWVRGIVLLSLLMAQDLPYILR